MSCSTIVVAVQPNDARDTTSESSYASMMDGSCCKFVELPHCIRMDFDVLAICSNCFALSVARQRLSHVESITPIVVVISNSSVDRVPIPLLSKLVTQAVKGQSLTPFFCTA